MLDEARGLLPRTCALLDSGRRRGLHPGGQLYISRHGETLADVPFGEVRPGEPMRPDHMMLWFSSCKPIAAIAIGRLWEEGRLDLDDPVARHVPPFGRRGKNRITIRHLLTHTAGIRLLDVGWPRVEWDETVARICDARPEPRWIPGRTAGYDRSASWFLLGEIVRRRDGRDFATYVREEILKPIGATDSWVGMPSEAYHRLEPRIVPMFVTEGVDTKAGHWTHERHLTRCHPGASGCGPTADLGRLYESLFGLRAGSPLSPQTVEALTARHRVGLVDKTFRRELDWGLGFIPNSRRPHGTGSAPVPYGYGAHASPATVGHSGYRSSMAFIDREIRLVVALAVNGLPAANEHEERFESLANAIYEDLGLASAKPDSHPGRGRGGRPMA